jgi:hypothetical protein
MTTSSHKMVDPNFRSEGRTRSYYHWRADGYDKVTSYEIKHHGVHARAVSARQPHAAAQPASATLEDAYLHWIDRANGQISN